MQKTCNPPFVPEKLVSPFPVVREMSAKGRLARVYIVRYKNTYAVCKVFDTRPAYAHRFIAEKTAYQLDLEFTPSLLEVGNNYLVVEFLKDYQPLKEGRHGLFNLQKVRQVFRYLQQLHNEGYSHLDFHPKNVMVSLEGHVKLVDFEHLYKYGPNERPSFFQSPSVLGKHYFAPNVVPSRWDGSAPDVGKQRWYPNYNKSWRERVGVSLEDLLRDRSAVIHVKRVMFLLTSRYPRFVLRKIGRGRVRV